MSVRFNPIAYGEWLSMNELEAAGMSVGKIIRSAIRCSSCGSPYALLIPLSLPEDELPTSRRHLQQLINDACGNHSPILQLGA
ncbi:MAG TPA: hypothetical protein VKW78_16840 [Terriglobales bacterium]|nr:hypothetical protein [Terriglobales bacterium]